jgi:predicted NBD/HSP70 family sugar kinase
MRMEQATVRLGIDLGGTKTEIVALDANHNILLRNREPTPAGDYAATLAQIARMVGDAETVLDARGSVGVATPGALSPASGRLRNSNSTCLNDQPLKEDLERLLGREVRLENDANCFALSEAVDGAAADAGVVFGVILGTGVGGGIVIDGRVLHGANAIAGEWGHNPLPWPTNDERPGPPCYCRKNGCIETFLSGPGLALDHLAASNEILDAATVAARAAQGDVACERTMARYEQRLARALATVINVLDPDVIVLGGGLSNMESLYRNVPVLWSPWVFSDVVRTQLVKNRHGDSSGVRGAAWLWD